MLSLKKNNILLISLIIITLASCSKDRERTQNIASAITHTAENLHITGLSYLVCHHDKVVDSHFQNENQALSIQDYNSIENNFSGPILLNMMIKEFLINEHLKLKEIIPSLRTDSITARDLIFVKSDQTSPWLNKRELLNSIIGKTINFKRGKHADLLSVFKNRTLKLEKKPTITSVLKNAFSVSNYFNKNFIEYSYRDTAIKNIIPTWYTRNLSGFFGWNVFKFQKETILWASFDLKDKTVLFIKSLDRDLFISIAYNKVDIFRTDFLHKRDMLQSPFALTVLKTLFIPREINDINYSQGLNEIERAFAKAKGLPSYIFLTRELLAYARFQEYSGNKKKARSLYNLYDRCLDHSPSFSYLHSSPIAEINYVPDNQNIVVPFEIDRDTILEFFGAGQMMMKDDYIANPENYDHIQIYLNKNIPPQDIRYEDLHLFQYNYGLKTVSGMKDKQLTDSSYLNPEIRFVFSDPKENIYVLETRIPWLAIGFDPLKKKKIGANLFIGDSDLEENYRKSMISWVVRSNEYWNDASKYGQIMLSDKTGRTDSLRNYCLKTNKAPLIDGLSDKVWDRASFSPIIIPYIGKSTAFDSSARFKTLYDKEYIYFLIEVTDNCKNKAGILTLDKCWITDSRNGEIIWKMQGNVTNFMPSFFVNDKINIKKGSYQLHYRSDKGHSFEGFYGPVPPFGLYGAQIYKLSSNHY
ncbi:sugar-binding protein [Pedobacter miscanthi]|uniref:Carbohydrate-binding domain-containing protein n=1 Tax=Pedobacter miscanthi TaxID=2259170 RepID=A0A366KMF6_9SPHI|nr:sugar-binding protein [Pedobacter miscanthi]RBQ02710.1 hypothetical protein DRW42_25535 [Pedobacter miscanthi]